MVVVFLNLQKFKDTALILFQNVNEPCLFWLEGHYSVENTAKNVKEIPIMEELKQICDHPVKNPVILIDDAR